TGKDTATNNAHARDGHQASPSLKGPHRIVRSVQPDQIAFRIVYPTVKEADEAFCVPLLLMAHHHFSVAANIEKKSNLPVLTTNNKHRLFVDNEGLKIHLARDLAFIGDVVPLALPVLVHSGLEAAGNALLVPVYTAFCLTSLSSVITH